MSDLEVRVQRRDGEDAAVSLIGELDISTVDRVESALRDLEEEQTGILLDLRELHFIDSTGLRMVVSGDARARSSGRRFAIVPGPDRVQRVFRVAGLEKRLTFLEGEKDGHS